MPSYNFLNQPADALGNDTDSTSMRGFVYGTTNQTAGEALTITTGFKPAYIAVYYGKNAKRAMLIYNEDCDFVKYDQNNEEVNLGSQFFATENIPLLNAREEWLSSEQFDNEWDFIATYWQFGIIDVFDTGFTLKATMVEDEDPIPTEDCVLWWFALDKMPSKTANTISGVISGPISDEVITVDCGFVPDFLVIMQTIGPETWSYTINGIVYWNKQRSINGYIGAGTGSNCNLQESAHTDIAYPSNTYGPWIDWTDSGFKVYGYDDNSFFYFAAKGLPEEESE